jgi:hypothetical protein
MKSFSEYFRRQMDEHSTKGCFQSIYKSKWRRFIKYKQNYKGSAKRKIQMAKALKVYRIKRSRRERFFGDA